LVSSELLAFTAVRCLWHSLWDISFLF